MNKFKYLITAMLLSSNGAFANASNPTAEQLKPFVPVDLTKDSRNGLPRSLGAGIGFKYIWAHLDGKKFDPYLVVAFESTDSRCSIITLKEQNKKFIAMKPSVLQYSDITDDCDTLETTDLNQDGKEQVVLHKMMGTSGVDGQQVVFRWDIDHLVDITPVQITADETVNLFRNAYFPSTAVDGVMKILDVDPVDPAAPKKFYILKNNKIVLLETFDYSAFFAAKKEAAIVTANLESEGSYTLTIKNISAHNRAVRAEVTVNGSVVLKPQDFCSAPAHSKTDKKWWGGHDDDDDNNFDNCKRCVPKNEAYAIVNMKTANEIKVKVYGMGNSKVQLTLVKK